MSDEQKNRFLDFDEYIRQGEPDKKEKASIWQTAIGLQAVDGLKTSDYLKETARKHIEGIIDIDQARELIKTYYQSKSVREPDDDEKQEADKVAANITKILSSKTFDYSTNGFISLHRRIFEGVFKHAGKVRDYDITKKEWVLEGDTVNYLNYEDLRNRYLHINPTREWSVQPNLAPQTRNEHVPDKYPTSTRQVPDKLHTDNPNITNLVRKIGEQELSVKEMMSAMGLKNRENFINLYINPAITDGYIRLLYPESPRHPRQKYLLTVKGLAFYKEIMNL